MAYIIRPDLRYRLGKTIVEIFDDDLQRLDAFFAQSTAYAGTILPATWFTGTHLPPEVMPKRLRLIRAKTMYDFLDLRSGGILVSARFREAVEELDPGRHQFFPVAIEGKDGAIWPGEFFIFNVVGRIEAIIEARSNFNASGREHIKEWNYSRRVGPWQCALDASIIGSRACWIEHRYPNCWFISDRLAALLKSRKLTGIELSDHSDEISL